MKLHDLFKQADDVVLHIGSAAFETDGFRYRNERSMVEGVPPEYDIHFDTSNWGDRYFINSNVEVTLDERGMAEVTVASAPDGYLQQGKLEFIRHIPLTITWPMTLRDHVKALRGLGCAVAVFTHEDFGGEMDEVTRTELEHHLARAGNAWLDEVWKE